ncbi:MAG: DNA topoisomerase [Clostridia bacterium]
MESVTKTKKKQLPPLLYDLTELQRDGNRKYGFSANRVLEIAQSLYERHKLVMHIRARIAGIYPAT